MRPISWSILLVVIVGSLAFAQSNQIDDSPKAVVEQLMRMTENGALLTPDGWKQAGVLFARPSKHPHGSSVSVISGYFVKRGSVDDQHAEVPVVIENAGRIDASLRFVSPDSRQFKPTTTYHLVRIGQSPEQWKIADAQGEAWTGVDGAIKYVTEMRAKAADPVVRKNADATLEMLKQLKSI